MSKRVGVLGGMGPMATADFFRKLIEETPAQRDQEHLPVIVHSVPQMPSRDKAITEGGESPLPQLLAGLDALKQLGAELVAIPCNTAHYWYDDLCRAGHLPIVHIVDAAHEALKDRVGPGGTIGLIATEATIVSRIYHDRLAARGYDVIVNAPGERNDFVNAGIERVKRGALEAAGRCVEQAVRLLLDRGAQVLILGCTEIPVALEAVDSPVMGRSVDATRALARATVIRALGEAGGVGEP